MNAYTQPGLAFEAVETAAADGQALVVALGAYEGPLHVLLELARAQKVDLREISVARLADQYLAFVRAARRLRFALAAEYLVMAAWLAYLKSRLLLPRDERPSEPGAAPEGDAEQLAFRLAKLDAMRRAAQALAERPMLGREIFPRGDPEGLTIRSIASLQGDLGELVEAYVGVRMRTSRRSWRPPRVHAYGLDDARKRLRALLPGLAEWTPLAQAAPAAQEGEGPRRESLVASTLSAALELTREGELQLQQADVFAPLYLRAAAG